MGVIACNKYGISGLRLFGKIEFLFVDIKTSLIIRKLKKKTFFLRKTIFSKHEYVLTSNKITKIISTMMVYLIN
jgi:hypothetical protein